MKKSLIILLMIIAALILGSYILLNVLFKEETRSLGKLYAPCNKEIAFNIIHYSEFDDKQAISFEIYEGSTLISPENTFFSTNNKDEELDAFSIKCQDSIVYVTFKNEKDILILYDLKTKFLFPQRNFNDEDSRVRDSLVSVLQQHDKELVVR